MGSLIWWVKIILIAFIAIFFLLFSAGNLISAYQMENPLEFVMTFFSQSLMLMISVVAIIYSSMQLYCFLTKRKAD